MYGEMKFDFNRDEIIAKVKENREAHIAEFDSALKGYYLELLEKAEEGKKTLKRFIKAAQAEEDPEPADFSVNLRATKPESHEDDYDRAIAMFEMAATDTITLDEQSFAQYVRDEWDWKAEFLASSTYYNSKFGG